MACLACSCSSRKVVDMRLQKDTEVQERVTQVQTANNAEQSVHTYTSENKDSSTVWERVLQFDTLGRVLQVQERIRQQGRTRTLHSGRVQQAISVTHDSITAQRKEVEQVNQSVKKTAITKTLPRWWLIVIIIAIVGIIGESVKRR